MSNRYEALISECHDNPMYTADMIVRLEAEVRALREALEGFTSNSHAQVYLGDECEKAEALLQDKEL